MTSRFHIMGQTQIRAWSLRRSELFTVTPTDSPGGADRLRTRGEVCCYCISLYPRASVVGLCWGSIVRNVNSRKPRRRWKTPSSRSV